MKSKGKHPSEFAAISISKQSPFLHTELQVTYFFLHIYWFNLFREHVCAYACIHAYIQMYLTEQVECWRRGHSGVSSLLLSQDSGGSDLGLQAQQKIHLYYLEPWQQPLVVLHMCATDFVYNFLIQGITYPWFKCFPSHQSESPAWPTGNLSKFSSKKSWGEWWNGSSCLLESKH